MTKDEMRAIGEKYQWKYSDGGYLVHRVNGRYDLSIWLKSNKVSVGVYVYSGKAEAQRLFQEKLGGWAPEGLKSEGYECHGKSPTKGHVGDWVIAIPREDFVNSIDTISKAVNAIIKKLDETGISAALTGVENPEVGRMSVNTNARGSRRATDAVSSTRLIEPQANAKQNAIGKGLQPNVNAFCDELKAIASDRYFPEPVELGKPIDCLVADLSNSMGLDGKVAKKDDERFYSKVLRAILDPCGWHQQGNKYLEFFVRYLIRLADANGKDAIKGILEEIEKDLSDVKVEKERGLMDLLIKKEGKWAIFIENKMCGETDQHRQIPRYFETLNKEGISKCVALYLKAYEDGAMPSGLGYEKGDEEKYGNLTMPVAAGIWDDKDRKSLLRGWLEACINMTIENNLAHQDLCLVKHLIEKRSQGTRSLRYAEKVIELMKTHAVSFGELKEKAFLNQLSPKAKLLVEGVEVYAYGMVARESGKIGSFTQGQLHDKDGKKMTCFFREVLGKDFLVVVDCRGSELSFNVRAGWKTAIPLDGISQLFGNAVFRVSENRYAANDYDNFTVNGMITSSEKLLKLIEDRANEIEVWLKAHS